MKSPNRNPSSVIRSALLGLTHETNTFSSVRTDLAKLEIDGILRGPQIVATHAMAHTSLAGFLAAGKSDPNVEVIPLMWAWANSSAAIKKDAFTDLTTEMLTLLRDARPWDAVFMAQHGATVSEQFPDADGEMVRQVREVVGVDTPIGVTFDMHANVSSALVDNATVAVGFPTNPHIDARERANECATLILDTVRGHIRSVMTCEQIPAVINILRQSTSEEPMSVIVNSALGVLNEKRIVSVSVFEVYPYADVEAIGMSCLTISDGDHELAGATNTRIASKIWSHNSKYHGYAYPPHEAVGLGCQDSRPNVLLDVGDNIGGGGPADSTILLEAALEAKVNGFLILLHDPEAVGLCTAAGLGSTVNLDVGAKKNDRHGRPILVDGKYEEATPPHGGFRFFDSGTTIVLELANDVLLVLTTKITLPTSLEQLRSLGIRPEDRRILLEKGLVSLQTAYGPAAGTVFPVNTPGDSKSDLSLFTYKRPRGSLHSFEAMV